MLIDFIKESWRKFKNCLSAYLFYRIKIKKLPPFWEVSFQAFEYGNGRLLFIHHSHHTDKMESAPINSFVDLCRTIENLGYKMRKNFLEYVGLNANSELIEYFIGYFTINIRQCQYDKCDIEWVEETVKKPKLTGLCADLIA